MDNGGHVEMKIKASDGGTIQNVIQAVIQHLTVGIRSLPTDYAGRIENFLAEYLGASGHPVPFGGREAALAALNAWLADPQGPPYLFLGAPGGRGKSALLVRWLEQLLSASDSPAIVFVPVSIRFNTNLASTVFGALAARLAFLHGEKPPADVAMSTNIWRGMVSDYLARPLADGRRLLVVLDGLDEAADWEAGADLFPLKPRTGLRAVVAARYRAGESDARGWLSRLGWERGLAHVLDLEPLTREGVADVLCRMGFPLDALGQQVDVVAELHRLSGGDPLLVRLYVDDLWAKGEQAARLRPEDLRGIQPGYEGYFDRWWQEQRLLSCRCQRASST